MCLSHKACTPTCNGQTLLEVAKGLGILPMELQLLQACRLTHQEFRSALETSASGRSMQPFRMVPTALCLPGQQTCSLSHLQSCCGSQTCADIPHKEVRAPDRK